MTRAICVTATDCPLVLVACREVDPLFGHDPCCEVCGGEGHVLVDEVFASDEILDHDAWQAHEAWWAARESVESQEAA